MRKINKIIIHHTGPGFKTIYDIWKVHVIKNKWSDIGYHFISFNGIIRLGRPLDVVGAHCIDHNEGSIGFCICGDYTDTKLDILEFSNEARFVSDLCRHFNLTIKDIYGHNEFSNTICPGIDMNAFRVLVGKYIKEWKENCHK